MPSTLATICWIGSLSQCSLRGEWVDEWIHAEWGEVGVVEVVDVQWERDQSIDHRLIHLLFSLVNSKLPSPSDVQTTSVHL